MRFARANRAERSPADFERKRAQSNRDDCLDRVRLLEHGTSPSELKCLACASEFPRPRDSGHRFEVSLRFAGGSRENDAVEGRLFVGGTVTLAWVNRSLSAELDDSSVCVGEPLIVGSLEPGPLASGLTLFCQDCGLNIASHASETSQSPYAVDRLVELIPERSSGRKGSAKLTRGAALADPRVRGYFLARQIVAEGGCSYREMCIRAMRAQIPLANARAALTAMGASYAVEDGEKRVVVNESPFFGQVPSEPCAADAPQAAPALEARLTAASAEHAPRERGSFLRTLLGRLRPEPIDLDDDWQTFFSDLSAHRKYNITAEELESLASVSLMGQVESKRDLLFMLDVLRGKRDETVGPLPNVSRVQKQSR